MMKQQESERGGQGRRGEDDDGRGPLLQLRDGRRGGKLGEALALAAFPRFFIYEPCAWQLAIDLALLAPLAEKCKTCRSLVP